MVLARESERKKQRKWKMISTWGEIQESDRLLFLLLLAEFLVPILIVIAISN